MNADRARSFLLTLPNVVETLQWGENLVFWVAEKALGGKMFTLLPLDAGTGSRQHPVASFAAGPERFADLVEQEQLFPAPYLTRAHWVAAERWDALSLTDWQHAFRSAHAHTLAKLPARTRAALLLPPAQRQQFLADRRRPPRPGSSISRLPR